MGQDAEIVKLNAVAAFEGWRGDSFCIDQTNAAHLLPRSLENVPPQYPSSGYLGLRRAPNKNVRFTPEQFTLRLVVYPPPHPKATAGVLPPLQKARGDVASSEILFLKDLFVQRDVG